MDNNYQAKKLMDLTTIEGITLRYLNCLNMYEVSKNSGISMEFILANMWIPWDWKGISRNPNIDFSLVERFPERNWCWMSLSSHPKITLETINSNPNLPWDKVEIVKNPNCTLEYYLDYTHKLITNINDIWLMLSRCKFAIEIINDVIYDRKWFWLSYNPHLTVKDLDRFTDCPLNFGILSRHPNLNIDWIRRYRGVKKWRRGGKDWDYGYVLANPNITMKDVEWIFSMIEGDIDKELFQGLSSNPSLDGRFYEKYLDKEWDYRRLSSNPGITIEIVKRYPDKGWDYYEFSRNPGITMEMIKTNPDIPWVFYPGGVSNNPNLTLEFLIGEVEVGNVLGWYWMSRTEFNDSAMRMRRRLNVYREELIRRCWEPKRLEWCLDLDERGELMEE